ncbi:hypothetical protein B0I35DRAFT_404309 [Stachybotrys elegans]|uniref:Uncharacterized protein n=1 Tax=Stachybotrys elegans TaxID=80388 RepID=A0A8K0T2K3_9HYPO|nr:hypothetical protein B0I35DRAFT_404309 [Stachybotrys elegans]
MAVPIPDPYHTRQAKPTGTQALPTQASQPTTSQDGLPPSQPGHDIHVSDSQLGFGQPGPDDELSLEPTTTDASSSATVSTNADDTSRAAAFLQNGLELTADNIEMLNRMNDITSLSLRLLHRSNTKTRSSLNVHRSTIYTCSEVDVADGPESSILTQDKGEQIHLKAGILKITTNLGRRKPHTLALTVL